MSELLTIYDRNFNEIGTDEAYARKLNAPGEWEIQLPSPGKANR